MIKFEHKVVTDVIFEDWQTVLNQYSEEGWELVTAHVRNGFADMFFKRPPFSHDNALLEAILGQ